MDPNDAVVSFTKQIMYIALNYIELGLGYMESWCWKLPGSLRAVPSSHLVVPR